MIHKVNMEMFDLEYIKFGKEDGEALVILPGTSVTSVLESKDAIIDAYQELSKEYMIYLFDYRKEYPNDYTIKDMAEDLYDALKRISLESFYLYGVSLGGMVAMDLTIQHPEMVKKLVLASTSARVKEDYDLALHHWASLAEDKQVEELYLSYGKDLYPNDVFEASKDLLRNLSKQATDEDLKRFTHTLKRTKDFDVTDALSKISCPVFIIHDQDDQIFRTEAAQTIKKCLTGSAQVEIYTYEGYGHAVYDLAPDIKERILEFLKKC